MNARTAERRLCAGKVNYQPIGLLQGICIIFSNRCFEAISTVMPSYPECGTTAVIIDRPVDVGVTGSRFRNQQLVDGLIGAISYG